MAGAMRRHTQRSIEFHTEPPRLGIVRNTSPLAIELIDSRLILRTDDIVFTAQAQFHRKNFGMNVGDTLHIIPTNDNWIVSGFTADHGDDDGDDGDDLTVAVPVTSFAANVGNASDTSFAVTHSLGTRDVTVQVYRNSSPWETVACDVERTSTSAVTVKFAAAPSLNQYRVVVTR